MGSSGACWRKRCARSRANSIEQTESGWLPVGRWVASELERLWNQAATWRIEKPLNLGFDGEFLTCTCTAIVIDLGNGLNVWFGPIRHFRIGAFGALQGCWSRVRSRRMTPVAVAMT